MNQWQPSHSWSTVTDVVDLCLARDGAAAGHLYVEALERILAEGAVG